MIGRLNLEYIAARRKELGMTQADMAARLGMAGAPDYCKYENGVYRLDADMVPALAKALDCSIESLFTGEKENDRTKARKILVDAYKEIAKLPSGRPGDYQDEIIMEAGTCLWYVRELFDLRIENASLKRQLEEGARFNDEQKGGIQG